jgi:anti-sigma B factor antagonist
MAAHHDSTAAPLVIDLRGEVDMDSVVEDLLEPIHTLERPLPATVVVDLRDVTFMDSTGLSGMLHVQRELRDRGSNLVIRSVPDQVNELLQLTHLHKILTVDPELP